ncbi:MAG TPA: translocation/assembly module TamB domain-containing protein, partial [Polyangiaceae bacterium]
ARVTTDGLRVVELRKQSGSVKTSAQATASRPRVIEGVDCDMQIDFDPSRGQANLQGRFFDHLGALVTVDAQSQLPPLAGADFRTQSETFPMHVALSVPERVLQKLPSFIRPPAMRGVISASIEAEGTPRHPKVRGQVVLKRLQSREGKYSVDAQIDAKYATHGGQINGHARSTRGGTATLATDWNGDFIGRIRQTDPAESVPFDLRSQVVLNQFPLAIIPALSDREIRGPLSGSIELNGLGKDANLRAKIDGSGVTVNRVRLPHLALSLSADDRELHASVATGEGVGSLRADVRAASRWGKRWIPELTSDASLRLLARQFQLSVLAPFVARYLSTIEGLLDADFSGTLTPGAPRIAGHAELNDGVVQVPQVGQRFSDVKARIVTQNNEIRLESMEARGISGRVTVDGSALLDGASLRSANARVDIREKEKLPVTLEGVMMGDAWGHAELSYKQDGDKAEIRVDVPRFRLKMPDAAQNSVQELEPADDVRIGAHRADGTFVLMPTQPLRKTGPDEAKSATATRVSIHLGDSVWIDRGRQVSVQVAGEIVIQSSEAQKIDGRVELKTGKLDVSGKEFHIERGVVTFDEGEASNPTITATARWDSPVGYVVYADYSGTVKDGKLKLHAEPNLTEDEILSLLLFGSPEGSIASSGSAGTTGALGSNSGSSGSTPGGNRSGGSSGSGSAGAAVSIAGGTATKGLNRAISDVTNLDVSTRIDTSTGSSRPELVVQLTPRLTTRVTRALGEPTPGQSPDRTFLTLELRLKRAWSASAMVGDHGASTFDLIWRKRY